MVFVFFFLLNSISKKKFKLGRSPKSVFLGFVAYMGGIRGVKDVNPVDEKK